MNSFNILGYILIAWLTIAISFGPEVPKTFKGIVNYFSLRGYLTIIVTTILVNMK